MAYVSALDGSWNQVSDASMKRDITPIESVLKKVLLLRPVTYFYKHNTAKDARSIGFLAQEAAEIFPNTVSKEDEGDLLGINYASYSVIAIKAIQEQQKIIEQQSADIELLKKQMEELKELIKTK